MTRTNARARACPQARGVAGEVAERGPAGLMSELQSSEVVGETVVHPEFRVQRKEASVVMGYSLLPILRNSCLRNSSIDSGRVPKILIGNSL